MNDRVTCSVGTAALEPVVVEASGSGGLEAWSTSGAVVAGDKPNPQRMATLRALELMSGVPRRADESLKLATVSVGGAAVANGSAVTGGDWGLTVTI
ncbi:hypothetical protein GUJ93_ZPchr0006g45029 [Zizania palustris]|uniref:Uncharacterized protein n=1 Tax=Zizania palustris TaxID=103762 RepID=A0A8J5VXJ4_ZIZPA|nr:hypothetical protein GUJ93_ZPchr0006g45029 [Zizania palustris]